MQELQKQFSSGSPSHPIFFRQVIKAHFLPEKSKLLVDNTPDILLNATINPDFSTVESDAAQLSINNSFALFNQEKRPFFLDNADFFESNHNLVYTRNINAPNVGAKVTARQGDHSIGLFVTDDDSTNFLLPGNLSSSIAEIDEKMLEVPSMFEELKQT